MKEKESGDEAVSGSGAPSSAEKQKKQRKEDKKRKKRNLWWLKAMLLSFLLAVAVNIAGELVLDEAQLITSCILTVIIVAIGVFFDIIGTAATSCDLEPFLSMASRKVKGAKIAVRLSKNADTVSSVCCDIVGDICGIVSGVCAATIVASFVDLNAFWLNVLIFAAVSTLTITLKAVGKSYAVRNANKIIYRVAKFLSLFKKEK